MAEQEEGNVKETRGKQYLEYFMRKHKSEGIPGYDALAHTIISVIGAVGMVLGGGTLLIGIVQMLYYERSGVATLVFGVYVLFAGSIVFGLGRLLSAVEDIAVNSILALHKDDIE